MVLPAPPADASPARPHWFDRLVVAIELSAGGVLTLVDHAAPARLREAYLRLRARDPATEVIVDVRRLAELPAGTTAILALSPAIDGDDLDWLNLNRPVVSDRRLSIVLWCEDDMAAALAQRAPDFFDWISARIDCPPAPAAHAVADVKRAICGRASGIAWAGPGLEDTLAALRPGRPVRRVAVKSYQSMIDALTSREPGWLFLEGIDSEFHLRRLRWAMAETGRRVIVFRRAFDRTAPGWWTVHAMHAPIVDAVRALTAAGGTGRLAALTGLDPAACGYAASALRRGIGAARLEELLAAASDPRAALHDLARQPGWSATDALAEDGPWWSVLPVRQTFESEAARHERDGDSIVAVLRGQPREPRWWARIGILALTAGDIEVEVRWLTAGLRSLSDDQDSSIAPLLLMRGQAHQLVGDLAAARADLERAHTIARATGDASMIASSAMLLATVVHHQGEPLRAREYLESALAASTELGNEEDVVDLPEVLATLLLALDDPAGARQHLERALSTKRRIFATENHPSIAMLLGTLGGVLAAQGDLEGARLYLEHSLEIFKRLGEPEHPNIVATLRALAHVYQNTGNLSGARAQLERALAIIQRVAAGSDEHPIIADILIELASVLAASGDLVDAQAMMERALRTQQKALGNDGQLAGAKTRRSLADVLVAKGDLAGAVGQLERALATLRRIFERDDHPEIASMLRELERLQRLQSDVQRMD